MQAPECSACRHSQPGDVDARMAQANLPPLAPQLPGTGYLRAGSLVAVVGTTGDFWLAEILSNGAAKVPWIRWLDSRGDDDGRGAIPYEWCVGRDPLDRQTVLSKAVLFNRRSCTLPRDEHVRLCELRKRHQHFPVLAAPKEVSVPSVTKESAPIKESAPAKEKADSSSSSSRQSSSDEIIVPAKKRRPPVKSTAKKAAKPAAKAGRKKPPSSSSASDTEQSSSSEEPPPPKKKAPVKKTTAKPAAKKAPAKMAATPAAKAAKALSPKSEPESEPADAPVWIQPIVDPTKAGLVCFQKLSKEGRARRRTNLYNSLRCRHPPSDAATSLDGVWDMYLPSYPRAVRRAAFVIKYPSITVQHADLRPGTHKVVDVEWKGGPAGVAFVLRVDDPPPGWSPVATYAVCTTGRDTAHGIERLRLHEGAFDLRRVAGEPVAGQGEETSQVFDTQMTPVVCSPERLKQQRSASPQSAWSASPPGPMPDVTPTDNAWVTSEAGRNRIEDELDACTPSHTTDYVPLHVVKKRSRSSDDMSPQPPEPKRARASQLTQQLMTQASTTVVMGRSAQPPTPAKPTHAHEVVSLSSGSLTQRQAVQAVGELSESQMAQVGCAKTRNKEVLATYVSEWLSRHPTCPGSPSTTSANATQLVKPSQPRPQQPSQPQPSQSQRSHPQPSPTPAAHQVSQSTVVGGAQTGRCVKSQAFQIWWTGMKSKKGYDQQAIRNELGAKLGAYADWLLSVTVETFGVRSVAVLHVNTSIRPLALRGLAAKLEHAVPVILNNEDFEKPQKRAAAAPSPMKDANTLMFVTLRDLSASANDLVGGHRILMDVGDLYGHEFISQLVLNTRARSTVAFVVFSVVPPPSIIERLKHFSYNNVSLCGKSPTSADAAKVPRPY